MPKKGKSRMDEISDEETSTLPSPVVFPNPSALKDSSNRFAVWISEAREVVAQTMAREAMLSATQNANDVSVEHTHQRHNKAVELARRNLAAYRDRERHSLSSNVEQGTKDRDQKQQDIAYMDPEWARQVRRIVDKHVENDTLKEGRAASKYGAALFYDASIAPAVPANDSSEHPALHTLETAALAISESQETYSNALTRAIHSLHAVPDSPAAAGKAAVETHSTHTVDVPAKIARAQYRKHSKSEQETIDRIQKERESILEVYRRTGDVTHKFSVAWIEKYHPNGFPLWKGSSKLPQHRTIPSEMENVVLTDDKAAMDVVDDNVQFDDDIDGEGLW